MGRERADIYQLGEKERRTTPKPTTEHSSPKRQTEVLFIKPKSASERYGYTTRQELKKNVDQIMQEDPKKLMQSAVDLYGERNISSIVAEGDPKNLETWFKNPDDYSLAGNPERSLTKIAVSIDFAKQLMERGAEKDAIRMTFIERQPKLGNLSLSAALARMGPEEIGLIHEIGTAIASGDTQIRTIADKKTAERFADSYTIPSRGH